MPDRKTVEVSRIYLQNDNPRHEPIDNEAGIIRHLLSKERVKDLARAVVRDGGLSPIEVIALTPHPHVRNAFVAQEGNRRVCALKLLADPAKAGTEANERFFRSLAKALPTPITTVEAAVFQDASEVRQWVSRRHEGSQNGIGTRTWDAKAKTRFNLQSTQVSTPNAQASLLIDYAAKHQLLTEEQLAAISITTLTRFLSNPIFRNTVGLDDNKTLQVSVPPVEFNRVAQRFLSDVATGENGATSRSSVAERRAYANQLTAEGIAPATRGTHSIDLQSIPKAPTTSAPKKRNNASPDARSRVVPSDFKVHISDKILKRLYDELRQINPDDFSFATAYLLRAVIEQICAVNLKKHGIEPPRELDKKLLSLADWLIKSKGKKEHDVKVLRRMASDKNHIGSPETMGHFVHGGSIPTRSDMIKLWDSLERLLPELLEAKK